MTQHYLLDNDAASAWLGINVVRADYQDVEITMQVRSEMLNGFGIAHGGMVFAFADTCFALACNDPYGDRTQITVAASADVDFLRPVQAGDMLTAVGTARHQGRSSGLYDVRVTNASGQLVAEFRGRCRTIDAPDASART